MIALGHDPELKRNRKKVRASEELLRGLPLQHKRDNHIMKDEAVCTTLSREEES